MKSILTLFLVVFLGLNTKAEDILTLTNQMKFEGKVRKIKNCQVKFHVNGKNFWIPAEDIYSIEFEDPFDKVLRDYQELDDPEKCMKGMNDADVYHGRKGVHIVLGVLFGPFAVLGAAMANPTPERGQSTYMMSKNKELFTDPAYLSCYSKKARGKNVGSAAMGWGAWILFILLLSA